MTLPHTAAQVAINVSALQALFYCPRQYYLQEVEGIHTPNAEVYSGLRLHTELERDGGDEWQQYTLESEALGLRGRVDALKTRAGRKAEGRRQKGYGETLQYSIIRVRLNAREREKLRWQLEQILTPEDSLLIVGLCNHCLERIEACNRPEAWQTPQDLHAIF